MKNSSSFSLLIDTLIYTNERTVLLQHEASFPLIFWRDVAGNIEPSKMPGSEGFVPMPVREGTGLPGREETFVAGAMAGASMMMFLCCSTCMTFIVL